MAGRGTSNRGSYSPAGGVSGILGLDLFEGRFKFFLVIFAAVAVVLFGRLVFVQVIQGPGAYEQQMIDRITDEDIPAHRGTIYDRNGNVLATSVEARKIVADPSLIEDEEAAAAQLAALMDLNKDDIYKKLATKTVTNEKGKEIEVRYQLLARQVDVEAAEVIDKLNIEGIFITEDTKRLYPYGQVGAQILGLVDENGNGQCGLELQYNEILSGTDGHLYVENGVNGNYVAGTYKRTDPVDGKDIVISIDIEMQKKAEQEVNKARKRMKGNSGQVVMLDGSNGEIIAMCSTPLLDPVTREGSLTCACVSYAFEPGSIFKPVTMLAALETGTVEPTDKMHLPKKLKADEYFVSDAHERPAVTYTVNKIMAQSSNVGLSLIGKKMGFDTLYKYIDKYHLNVELTNVDYPNESAGFLTDISTWTDIQKYNVTFGQGVMETPLQMTRFYGGLANDGILCTPHFLLSVVGENEKPTYETMTLTEDTKAIKKLNKMLCGVVKNGTGWRAALDGIDVAGKTGTAEYVDSKTRTYAKDSYNLSFIGYMPNSDSDLVCFVGITQVPMDSVTTQVYHDIMTYAIDRYNINQK